MNSYYYNYPPIIDLSIINPYFINKQSIGYEYAFTCENRPYKSLRGLRGASGLVAGLGKRKGLSELIQAD